MLQNYYGNLNVIASPDSSGILLWRCSPQEIQRMAGGKVKEKINRMLQKKKIPFSNETKRDFYFIKLLLRRYFQAFQQVFTQRMFGIFAVNFQCFFIGTWQIIHRIGKNGFAQRTQSTST